MIFIYARSHVCIGSAIFVQCCFFKESEEENAKKYFFLPVLVLIAVFIALTVTRLRDFPTL